MLCVSNYYIYNLKKKQLYILIFYWKWNRFVVDFRVLQLNIRYLNIYSLTYRWVILHLCNRKFLMEEELNVMIYVADKSRTFYWFHRFKINSDSYIDVFIFPVIDFTGFETKIISHFKYYWFLIIIFRI